VAAALSPLPKGVFADGTVQSSLPWKRVLDGRIQRLLARALDHDVRPPAVPVKYDLADMNLPEPVRIGKRLKEYMAAQPVAIREDEELVGWLPFDGSVESDLFQRIGHRHFWKEGFDPYYRKPQDALATFEWQHSCIDFEKVVRFGLVRLREEIAQSRRKWAGNKDRLDYLHGMELTMDGIEARVRNCAARCRELAAEAPDAARRAKLLEMAARCERVPLGPAESFLDGVQSVYFCYDFLADSIGRLDQYLAPLYFADLAKGTLTSAQSEEALQELFIYIHAHTSHKSNNYTRTAESHMTVGGVTKDGRDGWTDFSRLVVESCLALDILRPEISFRWHPGTKRETLRFILDCERRDPNHRIAFDGDVPRVETYARRFNVPIEEARDYCMTGCNECIFPGGVSFGGTKVNALRCMDRLFRLRREELCACGSWDEFRALFEREFHGDMAEVFAWCDRFNEIRSRDCNVLSALFLKGCIANAESPTRGGCSRSIPQIFLMGTPNLIDSLCIVKQFVFDERRCTMPELVAALAADWKGHEALRGEITRHGKFYGANDPFTNGMAQFVHTSLARFAERRRDRHGLKYDFGNLMGYNEHIGFFGALTGATPDGRKAGEPLSFGCGPAMNHGPAAATSQLLAAAKMDPEHVMCGGAIMNLTVSPTVLTNDTDFEMLVVLVETYFREGGIHLQLNHISRETLIDAQRHPEKYPDLRVRVSGFSGYFVRMSKSIQDEIIARTVASVR
jgi:formate C-acetyltransferase